ncbi:ABC transporter permease [Actinotalea sp. Marseille-Q4924]|uniref:ABC transporter permease n=1 Tax=Actinotalea sp. Marseille-Q4924 TaxID=2866571 RepID=UPI001CE4A08F|nr:ABC transporter permease [Actinotalea sp. Marseille-Q4924]
MVAPVTEAVAPSLRRSRRGTGRARAIGLPVLALVIIIVLWWAATRVLAIPSYLVPGPDLVVAKLAEFAGYLSTQTLVTLRETVIGFALAILIGVPVAMAIARFRTLEQMLYPLLLAVNAVPKVAIAPILVVWMGFGLTPKVVMVVLLCFFPIVLSTVAGLRSTPAELVELSRSLDAGELKEFVKVRFPWALPQIFVGLKTAISLAVIGAVIAEFVGSSAGLGYVIVQSGASADTALAFAAISLLALISIVLFYAIELVEKLLLPWAEENR